MWKAMEFSSWRCGFITILCLQLGIMLSGEFVLIVNGDTHYYDFILKETNFTRLCSTESILTVNDSLPGPVIRAHRGDTIFVNVHNHGDYGVTLHWHGIKQPRNPWSDGPAYITQCPIEVGSNFTYEIILSEEEGTLWWHAHSDWTRATVHGAIVILPRRGTTYPFPAPDGEEIVVLGAWYVGRLNAEVNQALEDGSDFPVSKAYTINGQVGDFGECFNNETTYRWVVEFGKTYLLKVVNAVVNAELFFAIAEHNLTLVGMDGAYLKPFVTSYIMISPGQTIDVLVAANNPGSGLYYMGARQYSTDDIQITAFDHFNVTAILQYSGSYNHSTPPVFPANLPMYLDYYSGTNFTKRLRSLGSEEHPVSVPRNISTRMFIVASMNEIYCPNSSCAGVDGTKVGMSLNNISWANPPIDILLAYYRNIHGIYTPDFPDFPSSLYNFTADDFPEDIELTIVGTKVKVLNYNDQVEIVFQGTNVMGGSVNHPMHLHGHSFYVVGLGYGDFDNDTDPENFNLDDPPQVNTFAIPKRGWIALRFAANNPGVWFWHCHLDRHMSMGMDTVFIVKNGGTEETSMRPPPPSMPPCPIRNNSSIISLKLSKNVPSKNGSNFEKAIV